jgi:hypothetical protein
VRLKRASKGATPFKLLEVEAAVQGTNLTNAMLKARKATVNNYIPFYGDKEQIKEEAKSVEDAMTNY